ncbi:hypothetical protein [Streptomyces naganishii]|uniref:Uncharacterized protein n=1 Tax=Streptomyces naganishii JCM 4654 TaxID=1306179 RepID=A0A919CUG4_9ACTN|nr:hypothetical protein [Streptomyces naganishii]GHD86835.1 hypothetical protein GCM10010508_16220 [Streptomyces naganishii JCM 4654]
MANVGTKGPYFGCPCTHQAECRGVRETGSHGPNKADRFDPATRRTCWSLALSQLDYAARRWTRYGWDAGHEKALVLLTDSWMLLRLVCLTMSNGFALLCLLPLRRASR